MFAKRLEGLRTRAKLTQQEMADKMGITRQAYNNYENGKRQPDYDTLIWLANFFEVTTDYLLGGNSKPIINDQAKNDVLEAYSRLPQDKKKLIDDMIKALTEEQR